MRYFCKIPGRNIYLSPINPEDAEIYTKWINDLPTAINLGHASQIFTLESEREMLETLAKEGQNFAIVLKENDELIGNCSLFSIRQLHRAAELGIFIGNPDHRGKGLGTEAVELLVEYGFKILNLNNIMLRVFAFNKGAVKAYEKAGFKTFGRRSQSYYLNGKYYDEIFMEILAKDCRTHYLNSLLPGE
ncbi:GNAT family N-acetyltransferase [Tuberibacillus calidus]|jgi:RimJ/RimL family protein N-acetyltransferase|uniref:GNAT family N-acetyltransferase n=1 Tax=Tuberibacillus calidus TaxID=340097 RepID=UPI000408332D|nr:GNAT family protein [Tuberibacillus calidus]